MGQKVKSMNGVQVWVWDGMLHAKVNAQMALALSLMAMTMNVLFF